MPQRKGEKKKRERKNLEYERVVSPSSDLDASPTLALPQGIGGQANVTGVSGSFEPETEPEAPAG